MSTHTLHLSHTQLKTLLAALELVTSGRDEDTTRRFHEACTEALELDGVDVEQDLFADAVDEAVERHAEALRAVLEGTIALATSEEERPDETETED